jgi:hypothetical protein
MRHWRALKSPDIYASESLPRQSGRMRSLPDELVAEITQRIQDPRLRHGHNAGTYVGTFSDPGEVSKQLGHCADENSAWNNVVEQMKAWGQSMPPMHVLQGEGFASASTERPDQYPLAQPANEADIAALEGAVGRALPDDLRQLYGIANGGWGPGVGFTSGLGTGFYSTDRTVTEYDDLRRRGADFCNGVDWPARLVPIGDMMGAVGYDLDTGEVVKFNEHYADEGLVPAKAFAVVAPDLATFLDAWLSS